MAINYLINLEALYSVFMVLGIRAIGIVFGKWPGGVRNQLFGEGNINLCLVV